VAVLLLDPTQLLLHIHRLHLLHASTILGRVWLSIIRGSCFLSARLLLGRHRHTSGAVIDVITLAGKTLEVVCDISRINGGRVPSIRLVTLFFPSRIEQFDWKRGQYTLGAGRDGALLTPNMFIDLVRRETLLAVRAHDNGDIGLLRG
jgi:hypothetical protein